MAAAASVADVAPFYLEADATPNPGGWPKGTAAVTMLPNDHLQYAITWFSLAVAAVVIYVLSQRGGNGRGGAGDDDPPPRPFNAPPPPPPPPPPAPLSR